MINCNKRYNTCEINIPVPLSLSVFSEVRLMKKYWWSHREKRQVLIILATLTHQKSHCFVLFALLLASRMTKALLLEA